MKEIIEILTIVTIGMLVIFGTVILLNMFYLFLQWALNNNLAYPIGIVAGCIYTVIATLKME